MADWLSFLLVGPWKLSHKSEVSDWNFLLLGMVGYFWVWFSVVFAKLCKVTINFVVSVCLSIHTEQLCSHWMDFHKIWYFIIFQKSVKIQVSLKSGKNNGYFTGRRMYIYDLTQFFSEWEMFQT
jgi:hypothetical protein